MNGLAQQLGAISLVDNTRDIIETKESFETGKKTRDSRSIKKNFSFSPSKLHNSPLFPKSGLPEVKLQNSEYTEYRRYLKENLDFIKKQSIEWGSPIDVSEETLVRELTFWKIEDFVWPNISHNFEGGVIFYWTAGGLNLRFERSARGRYEISVWNDKISLADEEPDSISADDFLSNYLAPYYDKIAKSYHPEWRSFFV